MAKSSRSSSKKVNNQRKASTINGPAELARAERLSARLLEIARQPKPESSDVNMDVNDNAIEQDDKKKIQADGESMEVDSVKPSMVRVGRKKIAKRQKKSKIVFQKYSDRQKKKSS